MMAELALCDNVRIKGLGFPKKDRSAITAITATVPNFSSEHIRNEKICDSVVKMGWVSMSGPHGKCQLQPHILHCIHLPSWKQQNTTF